MNLRVLVVLCSYIYILSSCCNTKGIFTKDRINYEYEAQAVNSSKNADGTILIKSWGTDTKVRKAKEQAKRNALRSLMFKGIPGSAVKRPLINEPGAEEKHRDYFARFFSEGGMYNQYIVETKSVDARDYIKSGCMYRVGMNLKINYLALQRELENSNITKKFGI